MTISLTPDLMARLNLLAKNSSEYIRRVLRMHLYNDEELEKKQQELEERIKAIEKFKGKGEEQETVEFNTTWTNFLENARAVINRDASYFDAQRKLFNNTFGQDVDKQEFLALLEKVKPNLHESKE